MIAILRIIVIPVWSNYNDGTSFREPAFDWNRCVLIQLLSVKPSLVPMSYEDFVSNVHDQSWIIVDGKC